LHIRREKAEESQLPGTVETAIAIQQLAGDGDAGSLTTSR
jgi:hypothetical protein